MASVMTKSLSIESGELAVPEPDASGVRVYKGIPYAAPPSARCGGARLSRLRRGQACGRHDEFGAHSVQGVVWDDIDLSGAGDSEDCLYLNVWTPAAPATEARLPVMVWIHGGGFVVGSGAEARYDGARLAARGIVVVTVNHRLNALGFLAHPELTAESEHHSSGAYGFLDLVAALQWVKRNIAAFGGDPDKVTIAGESAGSHATSALMASPLAKGLFRARHRRERSDVRVAEPRAGVARGGRGRRPRLHAQGRSAFAGRNARRFPLMPILAAAPGLGFRPIIDGWFLPRSPAEIFAAGEQSDVPLMAGWNKDEGFNFTLLQGDDAKRPYVELARSIFGERTEAALQHYPGGSPETDAASARALGGDLVIIHPTWAWIEAQKQSGRADIFRFRFDRAPLTPQGWFGERDSRDAGAFHAGELLYVFDNLHAFPWLHRRRRSRAGEARVELLDQLRQERRSQRPRPAALALPPQRRRSCDGAGRAAQSGAGGMAGAACVPRAGDR